MDRDCNYVREMKFRGAEYTRVKATRSSQQPIDGTSNDTISLNEETAIWLEAVGGKIKKGRVFGIGSEATEIGSSSTRASTSQASELYPLLQEEIDKRLEAANGTLKKTVDEQKEVNASLKQTADEQKEVIAGYKDKFEEYDRLFGQLFSKLQGDQGTPRDN
ncbi:uncharacterized protein G2W53_044406 [Senna tora]|uniref:Uncharacterized protein n=1 Tax=Senna tora TaxID=362788 RepID=A0A834SD72_9FABA|nr:uncharacterized protein G2W53_044406 [Senna tora]